MFSISGVTVLTFDITLFNLDSAIVSPICRVWFATVVQMFIDDFKLSRPTRVLILSVLKPLSFVRISMGLRRTFLNPDSVLISSRFFSGDRVPFDLDRMLFSFNLSPIRTKVVPFRKFMILLLAKNHSIVIDQLKYQYNPLV